MNTDSFEEKSEFAINLELFRHIGFFSKLPVEVIKLFALLCERHIYKRSDYIFHQGEDDGCSYYILSGKAQLLLVKNKKEYFIREYCQEHYFGALSLMVPMVKQFSLVALEDTNCMVMQRDAFSKVIAQFPDIPVKIMQTIGERVLQAEKKCIGVLEENEQDDIKNLLGISLI